MRVAFSNNRKARGLTYDEVAERSGVARRTVQRLETGERQGTLITWFYLARAVDMHLYTLVRELEEAEDDTPAGASGSAALV
jgi:putative transcriptional regulator